MSKVLIATVGLPRSGKTTWALSQHGIPIVSPQSIRKSLYDGLPYRQKAEPWIWLIAHTMVESLFDVGHRIVILDSTNVTRERRNEWRNSKWETLFKLITTPVNECCRRASFEMIPIIRRMYEKYEPLNSDEEELKEL